MFGVKLSSILAGGIFVLGSGALAFAQAGGPSDPPEDSTDHAQSVLESLEVVPETATNAVGGERGKDPGSGEENDASGFSEWAEGLELEGCERGLTIAANAQNGPTEFTSEEAVEAPADHPAFTEGNCTEGDDAEISESGPATGATSAEEGQANRPEGAADEEDGRDTADAARDGAGTEHSERGADAAEEGQANRPDDADEDGGRGNAPEGTPGRP